jgi:CRISPR-associated exonuclease Cas4
MLWLVAALLAAALLFFLRHRRDHALGGLPSGELMAFDHGEQDCPVLVSHRYGLKGKPDALVRATNGAVIPIERKKARGPKRVYDADLVQGLAYCMLVEDTYGQAPPFVRIQYADRWFDEPYTPDRRKWVLAVSERLRQARKAGGCNRSHQNPAKCISCGQRPNCGQALR